jgi:hypothetical protein
MVYPTRDLVKHLKNTFPMDNELPTRTYEVKQLVCPLRLEVHKIYTCPNDCILYRVDEYKNFDACPICSALGYKIRREDPGDVEGERPRMRVPAKVMWYSPIIPHSQCVGVKCVGVLSPTLPRDTLR